MDGFFQSAYQKLFSADSEVLLSERVTGIATIAAVIAFCILLRKVFNWDGVKTNTADKKKRKKEPNPQSSEEGEESGSGDEQSIKKLSKKDQQVAQLKKKLKDTQEIVKQLRSNNNYKSIVKNQRELHRSQKKSTNGLQRQLEQAKERLMAYEYVTEDLLSIKDHFFANILAVGSQYQKYIMSQGKSYTVCSENNTIKFPISWWHWKPQENDCSPKKDHVLFVVFVPGAFSKTSDVKTSGVINYITEGIKNFASKLAVAEFTKGVHIQWFDLLALSGSESGLENCTEEGRTLASKELLPYLKKNDGDGAGGETKIWFMGNGKKGFGVLNSAADVVRDEYRIDYGVFFDANETNFNENQLSLISPSLAFNYNQLFHLNAGTGRLPLKIAYHKTRGAQRIWNISVKAATSGHVKGISHEYIKVFTLLGLEKLISDIEINYPAHFDLDAEICFKNNNNNNTIEYSSVPPVVTIKNKLYCSPAYLTKEYQQLFYRNGRRFPSLVGGKVYSCEQRSDSLKKSLQASDTPNDVWTFGNNLTIKWNELKDSVVKKVPTIKSQSIHTTKIVINKSVSSSDSDKEYLENLLNQKD